MTTTDGADRPRPELAGPRVRLRPGDERDVPVLCAILAEPEVACWWGDPEPASVVAAKLRGDDESVLLVIETAAARSLAGSSTTRRMSRCTVTPV